MAARLWMASFCGASNTPLDVQLKLVGTPHIWTASAASPASGSPPPSLLLLPPEQAKSISKQHARAIFMVEVLVSRQSRRQRQRPGVERDLVVAVAVPVQRDTVLRRLAAVDGDAQELAGREARGQ